MKRILITGSNSLIGQKIEQYLIQIPLQEVESVDSSAVNRILNKLLNDDSVKKDIKKIRNLKQVQEIQKFIKLH